MANQDTSPYKYNTQLHMYRPDVPLEPVQIPEGYTLRSARLEDGPQWCHCCRDGYLSVEEESQELFEKNMLNNPAHVTLDHIYVLENPEHQIVATATAMLTDDPTHGKLHMVANPVEFRGHGFSKVVCWAVVDTLQKLGRTTSSLSTDDFRLGAIKTYLRLGYLPVLYQEDMEARWLDVMKVLGYSSLKTVLRTDGVHSEGPTLTLSLPAAEAQTDTTQPLPYAQLLMFRPDIPVEVYPLPEGYILRSARLEDGPQWCHCCRSGGLGIEEETQEQFVKSMLSDPNVALDRIFMLENQDHQIVATATAQYTADPTHGKLHMVANPVEFRGMGLSKYVCAAVVDTLRKNGRSTSELVTDDNRLGAIKTYLRLGYLPVLNREDMEARWLDVMKALGYSSLKTMLHTDGVYSEGPALTL